MQQLGDSMWQYVGSVEAAHICYIVADAAVEPFDPIARMVLVGADHKRNPNGFVTLKSVLCTEILEYARSLKSGGSASVNSASLVAFKLYHAKWLIDLGMGSQALDYLQPILSAVRKGFKLGQASMTELQMLEHFLQKGVGKKEGGAASKLFGGWSSLKGVMDGGFKGAFDSGLVRLIHGTEAPSVPMRHDPSAAAVTHAATISTMATISTKQPSAPSSEPHSAAAPTQQPETKKAAPKESKTGSSGSGWLSKLIGGGKAKKEMDLGESNNDFYYDEASGKWRRKGQENVEEEAPAAPPSMAQFAQNFGAAPAVAGEANGGVANVSTYHPQPSQPQDGGGIGMPAGMSAGGSVPMMVPPKSMSAFSGNRKGPQSRYVNTFSGDTPQPAAPSPAPAPMPNAAPKPSYTIFTPKTQ